MIKAIVVVDSEWGIGCDGDLLVHLPKDLKRFKAITQGHMIVMGRKTLESLPGGKPLPGREHVVLTRDKSYKNDSVQIVYSKEELLRTLMKKSTISADTNFFICGGGEVYKQLLPFTSEVIVTKINSTFAKCDTHFPNLDMSNEWVEVSQKEGIEDNGYDTSYILYGRS